MLKKLLIGIIVLAAVSSSTHAQAYEKTLKYVHRGSGAVWMDEDIIGDANRTGVARALNDMQCLRKLVAEGRMGRSFIHFDFVEK